MGVIASPDDVVECKKLQWARTPALDPTGEHWTHPDLVAGPNPGTGHVA
jgi:hypothetical protein